jgi:DnaJ-class molecular chaperone
MGVEKDGRMGDQYVEIKILVPEKLDDKGKELMEQFARKEGIKY